MESQQVYGIHPVMEALDSDKVMDRVYIEKGNQNPQLHELSKRCRELGVPIFAVPIFKLNQLSRKNHQGVIGIISQIEFSDVDELVAMAYERGEQPLVLLLDGITDVRNFGAIARTAECAGVHAIVIPERNSAPVNEDAIRTSSGALMRIPVCRVGSLRTALDSLSLAGLKICGLSEKGKQSLYETDLKIPLALVMGAEDTGLSDVVLRKADELLQIPLAGKVASLNVGVATGIALFETLRQRAIQ